MIDLQLEGFLTPAEGERLFELCKNKNVLEIGSYKGRSTWFIAIGAKLVFCIDPMKMLYKPDENRIDMTDEYTTLKDFTNNILTRFRNVELLLGITAQQIHNVVDEYFDVVFIDGWHSYEACEQDILLTWGKLKEGGVMVIHDFGNFEGVSKCIFDYFLAPQKLEDSLVAVKKLDKTPLHKIGED